jgi:hypothetical protein
LLAPAAMIHNIPAFRPFSWIYPATLLVMLLAVYFWPWVRSLPLQTRIRLLWAGTVYLAGAVGFEAIGGIEAITIGLHGWAYVLTYTTEEVLEMIGVLLLIRALLKHLRERSPVLEIRFGSSAPPP